MNEHVVAAGACTVGRASCPLLISRFVIRSSLCALVYKKQLSAIAISQELQNHVVDDLTFTQGEKNYADIFLFGNSHRPSVVLIETSKQMRTL